LDGLRASRRSAVRPRSRLWAGWRWRDILQRKSN